MAQWYSVIIEVEWSLVRNSPEALHCVLEQETLNIHCLVQVQHRAIGNRPDLADNCYLRRKALTNKIKQI